CHPSEQAEIGVAPLPCFRTIDHTPSSALGAARDDDPEFRMNSNNHRPGSASQPTGSDQPTTDYPVRRTHGLFTRRPCKVAMAGTSFPPLTGEIHCLLHVRLTIAAFLTWLGFSFFLVMWLFRPDEEPGFFKMTLPFHIGLVAILTVILGLLASRTPLS